jgi:lysozyme
MKFIDVSNFQGVIDYAKLKAVTPKIDGVLIQATQGLTFNNGYLMQQYNGASAAGLNVGVYHFLRADGPIAEAEHFLSVIKGLKLDCLCFIDVEIPLGQSSAQICSNVVQFASHLTSNGYKVGVYSSDAFYSAYLTNPSVRALPLWVAHYGVAAPDANPHIGFQYSESGVVNGIVGDVDLSTFSDEVLLSTTNNIAGSVANMIMRNGETSRRVSLLQSILNVIFTGSIKDIDGNFGPITLALVDRYQKAMGLPVTGFVDVPTITMLLTDLKNNYFKI